LATLDQGALKGSKIRMTTRVNCFRSVSPPRFCKTCSCWRAMQPTRVPRLPKCDRCVGPKQLFGPLNSALS